MRANLWRWLMALCDLRAWRRFLAGRPAVDVVFIANLRDEQERRRFCGRFPPAEGHADGPRIHLGDVAARVRGIDVTAEELLTREGRRRAQAHFMAACAWAEAKGARVILLAASTKRLFGRDGRALKQRFPNLLFTIGDNGTAHLLWADTRRAFERAGLAPGRARVMVIGPYGILGRCVTEQLVHAGYEVVGYGANGGALQEVAADLGIAVTTQIAEAGTVDAVVACTHSAPAKLSAAHVASLARPGRKLLVVDVAEPANLDRDTWRRCRRQVVRQDAGNAWVPGLRYVLGPLSWRMLWLSRGVVFGCFAEALSLYHAIHRRGLAELAQLDWFEVEAGRRAAVAGLFAHLGFTPPPPRCFGLRVRSHTL